jgi:hypothetical protein
VRPTVCDQRRVRQRRGTHAVFPGGDDSADVQRAVSARNRREQLARPEVLCQSSGPRVLLRSQLRQPRRCSSGRLQRVLHGRFKAGLRWDGPQLSLEDQTSEAKCTMKYVGPAVATALHLRSELYTFCTSFLRLTTNHVVPKRFHTAVSVYLAAVSRPVRTEHRAFPAVFPGKSVQFLRNLQ